jgi:hypothetical protein
MLPPPSNLRARGHRALARPEYPERCNNKHRQDNLAALERNVTSQSASAAPDDAESVTLAARRAAYELLLDEARRAAGTNNAARFDDLMAQLLYQTSTTGNLHGPPYIRQERMDRWRVSAAFVLIFSLVLVVAWALSQAGTGNGQTNAQYVSIISGLAGIAIGWLYGSGTSRVSGAQEDESPRGRRGARQ